MMTSILLKILNQQAASSKNKPDKIIKTLGIEKGNIIADIGAGGGYYSLRFAQETGSSGLVYSIDVEQSYLEFIARKAKKMHLTNIHAMLAGRGSLQFPYGIPDLIFMRDVFHDISNAKSYFQDLYNLLKIGGKIAIIDFLNNGKGKESLTGHCSDENHIYRIMIGCGFEHVQRHEFLLDRQSYNIFKKN